MNIRSNWMKKSMHILISFTVLSNFSFAVVTYDDGLVHDIDFFLYDTVFVLNSSTGEPTSVNIVDGGSIYYNLSAYGDSNVRVAGGSVNSSGGHKCFVYDKSTLEISGGMINDLSVYHDSIATINGGSITYNVFAYNNSIVNIYGGAIGVGMGRDLIASNYAKVFMSGGSIGRYLEANNDAEILFSGGSIAYDLIAGDNSQVVISGGSIGRWVISKYNAQVVVVGTGFNYPLGYISGASGTLTGTLASGDPLDVSFTREGNGAILLKDPEIIMAVLSPNGGERLLIGKMHNIEFTVSGNTTIDTVDIEYSNDNGSSWHTIATTVPNSGLYKWTTPNTESEMCLIRVSSSDNPTITDTSDGTFIIFQCSEVNPADINGDCYVNLLDFALFAENWLWCGDRYNPDCGIK
jgi:hypothetical protein